MIVVLWHGDQVAYVMLISISVVTKQNDPAAVGPLIEVQ